MEVTYFFSFLDINKSIVHCPEVKYKFRLVLLQVFRVCLNFRILLGHVKHYKI